MRHRKLEKVQIEKFIKMFFFNKYSTTSVGQNVDCLFTRQTKVFNVICTIGKMLRQEKKLKSRNSRRLMYAWNKLVPTGK